MRQPNFFFFSICIIIFEACTPVRTVPEPVELIRKPYLQSAIADSLSILWRTDAGEACKVGFREKDTKDWTFVDGITRLTNTKIIENEVTLHNLLPDVTYEYQIFTDQSQLLTADTLRFTAPISRGDSVYTFFAVGDIGEPVADGGTPDLLAKALTPFVDSLRFGLLLGDIIYPDGKSEVYDQNLFQYFGDVFPYVPVFPVLGNHDWHQPEENYIKEWKLPGNEHYYSFDYGNTHFIGLDTKNGELYEFDKQVAWFKKDLSNRSKDIDWTIVFLHHNGKSCTYKDDYEGVVKLYPIFAEYGVDLVLNGHAHTYERLNPMDQDGVALISGNSRTKVYNHPEGFISITVGSGGKLRGIGSDPKPFTPDPDNCKYPDLVAAYSHQWAFLSLKIEGRTLMGTAIGTENLDVIDQFEIDKR